MPCSSDGGFDHRACVYAGISCVMRYHTTVEIECKNPWQKRLYADKHRSRRLIALSVENNGRISSISKRIAWVRYENFFPEKGNMKVRFSVDTGKRRGRKDSCGDSSLRQRVDQVEKVRIYDYLSTFLLPPLGKIMRYRMCFVMLISVKRDLPWKRPLV